MDTSRQKIILDHVIKDTEFKIEQKDINSIGIDALTISLDLDFHRSNVSMELNKLWKKGTLVKMQGRPTLFFDLSTFERKFPNTYIPSYITLNESISEFLNQQHRNESDNYNVPNETHSDEMISALSAIAYPPNGLPLLVYGDEGTGKVTFVKKVIELSKKNGVLENNIRIKYINCNNSDSFNEFTHEISNSILYIFQNPEFLAKDQLSQLLDMSIPLETTVQNNRKRSQHIIIISTTRPNDDFNDRLYKITPINVYLPNLEELSPIKKIKAIVDSFKYEASNIGMNISININLFITFCEHYFKYNYNSISSEVQNSIALAHYRSRQKENKTVSITYDDLSKNIHTEHSNTKRQFEYELLFSNFTEEYVFFTRNQSSNIDDIIKLGSDELEFALKSFKLNFKTNCSNLNYDIKELSDLYSSFYPHNQPTILSQSHRQKISALKKILNSSIDYSLPDKELYFFILYCIILTINQRVTQINKEKPFSNNFLEKLVENEILNIDSNNYLTLSIIETVIVELQNVANVNNPQLIIIVDDRIQVGIYESILTPLEEDSYYFHYANRNLTTLEIKREIDQIILNKLKPIDTLIVTDIYNIFRNRITLKDSLNIDLEVVYPLSLPLLDKCVNNLKAGYTVNDFKDINTKQFDAGDQPTQKVDSLRNSEFIDKLNTTILARDLNFIDSRKSTPLLTEALEVITNQLKIELTKNLIVKFIIHGSFMLERVIMNESIIHPNLKEHYANDSKIVNIIKMNFGKIEDSFGITIPPMEVAYVADIFISFIDYSKNVDFSNKDTNL